jgi:hypothetical protein
MDLYYEDDGEIVGPVSIDEFANLILAKTIGRQTLVWFEGMLDWGPAEDQQALKEYFAPVPPPLPGKRMTTALASAIHEEDPLPPSAASPSAPIG